MTILLMNVNCRPERPATPVFGTTIAEASAHKHTRLANSKKAVRQCRAASLGEVPSGGGRQTYCCGGCGCAGGVFCAAAGASTLLLMRRTSTRRFLARPELLAFDATGWSLPNPIT